MKEQYLKACPNPDCQSQTPSACWEIYGYCVICSQCHMQGPLAKQKDYAVKLWNELPRTVLQEKKDGTI